MSQTGIPLFANGQYLPPYSGMHDMGTENVREIPVAKKGGQKGLRQFTSKNIQTSLNDIMQRNTTLFGSSGKKRYKPDLNYNVLLGMLPTAFLITDIFGTMVLFLKHGRILTIQVTFLKSGRNLSIQVFTKLHFPPSPPLHSQKSRKIIHII